MKKYITIICILAVIISIFSACSCAKEEKAEKTVVNNSTVDEAAPEKTLKTSDYVLSSDYNFVVKEKDMYSTLLYTKGKYIYSNKNGIYVKDDIKSEGRRISKKHPRTEWSNGAVLSNGETVYYLVVKSGTDSEYEYTVYSVGVDGKNEKKVLKGIGPATLITVYNGNLYFRNSPDTSAEKDTNIMKYKLDSNKDPELVSLDYQVNYNCFYNGKIYFSNDNFNATEALSDKKLEYNVYSLDLDSEEINKELPYSYGESITAADSENAAFYSRQAGKEGKIYLIDKADKKYVTKPFKANRDPWFIDKNCATALMCDFNNSEREVLYSYSIKSGEQKKLSTAPKGYTCEKVTTGLKAGDTPYIVFSTEGKKAYSRLAVQKVSGDKATYCNLGGKKSVDADVFWITEDKLVTEVKNNIKVYDLI